MNGAVSPWHTFWLRFREDKIAVGALALGLAFILWALRTSDGARGAAKLPMAVRFISRAGGEASS